jgi:hypothetical protein
MKPQTEGSRTVRESDSLEDGIVGNTRFHPCGKRIAGRNAPMECKPQRLA